MISLYIYNIFLGLDMAIFLLNYIYFYFIFFTLFGSDDVIVHDDDGVCFTVFEYEIKVIVIIVK
jgi:hypothetical protein